MRHRLPLRCVPCQSRSRPSPHSRAQRLERNPRRASLAKISKHLLKRFHRPPCAIDEGDVLFRESIRLPTTASHARQVVSNVSSVPRSRISSRLVRAESTRNPSL